MTTEKLELEFDTARFMNDIRNATNKTSLRDIADIVGISASSLSRIDNGTTPDMSGFITVCQCLMLTPGKYFKWVKWVRVEDEK